MLAVPANQAATAGQRQQRRNWMGSRPALFRAGGLQSHSLAALSFPPLLPVQAESQAIRVQNGQLDAETLKVGRSASGWCVLLCGRADCVNVSTAAHLGFCTLLARASAPLFP